MPSLFERFDFEIKRHRGQDRPSVRRQNFSHYPHKLIGNLEGVILSAPSEPEIWQVATEAYRHQLFGGSVVRLTSDEAYDESVWGHMEFERNGLTVEATEHSSGILDVMVSDVNGIRPVSYFVGRLNVPLHEDCFREVFYEIPNEDADLLFRDLFTGLAESINQSRAGSNK